MSEATRSSFGGIPIEEKNEPVSRFGGVPTKATSQFIQTDAGVRLAFNATYQDTDETLYDDDLVNDVNFQKASEVIYNMNNSVDAERLESPEDYAKYGIEQMGWFNWNLPNMSIDANRISGATDEQQRAFLYMMESYDDLGMSWNGAKRFFKGVLTDPTTYVGLTTFGIGIAGKEGAKQAGKQGIKELLKRSTRGGIIAGVESGVYTAVDDVNRQVVETAVSGEDIDAGRVAKSGAIGVATGFGLGTALTAGVKKIQSIRGKSTKEIAETVDEAKIIDELPDIQPQAVPRVIENLKLDSDGILDVDDLATNLPPVPEGYVRLYKGDSPTATFDDVFHSDGLKQYKPEEGTKGRYWTDDPSVADFYREAYDINRDARISYVDVPKAHAEKIKVDDGYLLDVADLAPKARQTASRLRTSLDGVIQAIKRTVPAGKVAAVGTDGVQNMEELVASVQPIKELLAEAAAESPAELAEYLKRIELTDGQSEFLEVATTQTVSALKVKVYNLRLKQQQLDGEEALAIQKQIDEIEEVVAPLDELDVALSTITGQRLRARQTGENTAELRGTTIQSLMAEGFTRTEAERQFDAIFAAKLQKREVREVTAKFDTQIEEARKSGDMSEFLRLKHEKKVKLDEFKEDVIKEESLTGTGIYETINKPIRVLNEIVIGNVFSPATQIINTVPSLAKALYKPFLNNLMQDGLSATSRKKMVAEYSAMASMIPTAAKMAKAAWRYEKSILTGDSARFLEEYNVIPKKYKGHWVRLFPRMLLATDAFFENIHYRGYVVGNATGKAMEEGVAKGLKGKELDDFVKAQTQKAIDKAYAPEETAVDILLQDGISRGLKGKKLENFVNKELAKNESTFIKATDQQGRNYVQDVLFKRDFSGKGAASSAARGYESFVNKHPVMRLSGQLFFRTPVRVFEEGIRLTPGLNLVSPKFIADLKGDNGTMRQARAQGEAMMSYAIAGYAFTQYATGNLTGAMGTNYKQTRQGENAGGMEPYSIKFSDGSTFNYRNFDPFSTPIKILVNAMERAETLAYRREQGERISDDLFAQTHASVSIAVASIYQSIRDANLTSGIDEAIKVLEASEDVDGAEKLFKYFGQKAQTFLPNTYYKFQMLDNPVLSDPKTFEQFIRYRINPDDPLVPKQYTAFGRPRTDANPSSKLYYFSTASVEDRKRGKSDKEIEAEEFLYKLAQVGDTHFTAPHKMTNYMGDVDLRTQLTKDGTESYYDRWMRYTLEQEIGGQTIVDVIHSMRDLPMGTKSTPGIAETQVNKYLRKWREAALVKLLTEEGNLIEQRRSVLEKEAKAKAGQRSIDNIPHNITGTR